MLKDIIILSDLNLMAFPVLLARTCRTEILMIFYNLEHAGKELIPNVKTSLFLNAMHFCTVISYCSGSSFSYRHTIEQLGCLAGS